MHFLSPFNKDHSLNFSCYWTYDRRVYFDFSTKFVCLWVNIFKYLFIRKLLHKNKRNQIVSTVRHTFYKILKNLKYLYVWAYLYLNLSHYEFRNCVRWGTTNFETVIYNMSTFISIFLLSHFMLCVVNGWFQWKSIKHFFLNTVILYELKFLVV